jgi:hypothetical protein
MRLTGESKDWRKAFATTFGSAFEDWLKTINKAHMTVDWRPSP